MNRVELVGRTTIKPQLEYTDKKKAYTRFGIAINRTQKNEDGESIADFINVVAWEKQAENVCMYVDKGNLIAVEGSIQTGSYTDKDGNKRTSFNVLAHRIEFLQSKNENKVESKPIEDPYADYGQSVTIDDNFLD